MTITPINPAHILNNYRKSDAVIIICQNNAKKIIEIAALNQETASVAGYSNAELVGESLSQILPERINSTLAEFFEYGKEEADVMTVLNKVRNFAIKTKEGKEIEFRLRIIRGEEIDKNPWFHLVLINEIKLRQIEIFYAMLRENFKGHEVINPRTQLPDRNSLIKDLELLIYHVRSKEIQASFAIVEMNYYDKLKQEYGEEVCDQLHHHIGHICKQKLRSEDTVGSLSESALGVILVNASQESSQIVLNRLRWAINSTPLELSGGKELLAQVNVYYTPVESGTNEQEVLTKCEAYTKERKNKYSTTIQLVVTFDRRGKREERRKQAMSVVTDRRRRRTRRTEPKTEIKK